RDFGTQHVASGDLGDAVTVLQTLRLGAFACAGRPQQYQLHVRSRAPARSSPVRSALARSSPAIATGPCARACPGHPPAITAVPSPAPCESVLHIDAPADAIG